jgi:hypothetical protein
MSGTVCAAEVHAGIVQRGRPLRLAIDGVKR